MLKYVGGFDILKGIKTVKTSFRRGNNCLVQIAVQIFLFCFSFGLTNKKSPTAIYIIHREEETIKIYPQALVLSIHHKLLTQSSSRYEEIMERYSLWCL